jgi:hypothetical protein
MKPSPIGSKLLSAYGIVFAGLMPAGLAAFGLAHGIGSLLLLNVILGLAVAYFGARVFAGDYRAVKLFAALVILNYLGLTASNIMNFDDFPEGSRAQAMAIPRMIRGVIFASVYAWYYLLRRKTAEGFTSAMPGHLTAPG